MIFNKHSNLQGTHAFLGASKYHWMNYDIEKLERTFMTSMAAQRGTDLHALAHDCIRLGVKLRGTNTLARYVNDCLGYRMSPEVTLYYSDNCYGHADAIDYRRNRLRIFDLKTGVIPGSVHQLEVYAALFCLEYGIKPHEIEIDLRIYQNDEVIEFEADPDVIAHVMDKIIVFDRRINELRMEAMA